MKEKIIEARNLVKTFSNGSTEQNALDGLDIDIYKGDFTVIMGPSGAGKSTLLYALSGMDNITSGSITYNGVDITKMSNNKLAVFRRKNCGFLFQKIHLLETMSIMDNVLSCGYLTKGAKRKDIISKAKKLFGDININEELWNKFPSQLSGGEAQRCGIVRAIINDPTVVFADEPTGALNSANSSAVLNVLSDVNSNSQSIVMVTHDFNSALRGNRIIYIRDGKVMDECELGTYSGNNISRREVLRTFLTKMGW